MFYKNFKNDIDIQFYLPYFYMVLLVLFEMMFKNKK